MSDPVVVIGGGIVGLATARALAEDHHRRVILLETESELAAHQTGHNSGVLHSGIYYRPGSLKAALCRTGLAAMYRFCAEENVPHRRCGKLVVATDAAEAARLGPLEERARANGCPVRPVSSDEIREIEPAVTGVAALWVEDTGVVAYREVCRALARRIGRAGGEIHLGAKVHRIVTRSGRFVAETSLGAFEASGLVACAGLQADRVARMAGLEPAVHVVPFRGEYYRLRPERASLVRGLVYPVSDPALPFLGVHFTRGVDDAVEAGPNAVLALKREGYAWSDVSLEDLADMAGFPGFWRLIGRHWRTGVSEVLRSWSPDRFLASLRRLIPSLTRGDLAPGGSGVRAQAVDAAGRLVDDFALLETPGAIHVLNAPSPAATASLAIGTEIARRLVVR